MPLLVSVDVLPADLPVRDATILVEACTGALSEGRCSLAADLPESASPAAVALVLWQGDGLTQATVRVGRGDKQWLVRVLNFSEDDSIAERCTTVGLTVATLVGDRSSAAAGATASEELTQPATSPLSADAAESSGPAKPASVGRGSSTEARWSGALGALAGPGWSEGDWQRGGWLALTYRLPRLPIQVHATSSYSLSQGPLVQLQSVRSRWLTVGAGLGLFGRWPRQRVAGSIALEAAYRRVTARLPRGELSAQDLPIRLRGAASVPANGPVGATIGVLLGMPATKSRTSKPFTLRTAAVAVEAIAGIEVRL